MRHLISTWSRVFITMMFMWITTGTYKAVVGKATNAMSKLLLLLLQ